MAAWCIGAVFFLVCIWGGLNMSGFCWADKRWLSDEEKIKMAVQYHMHRKILPFTIEHMGQFIIKDYEQIPYQDFDEFKALNPNCCTLNPKGSMDLPPRSLSYNYTSTVRINYLMRYIDESGTKQTRQISFDNGLDNCGNIF